MTDTYTEDFYAYVSELQEVESEFEDLSFDDSQSMDLVEIDGIMVPDGFHLEYSNRFEPENFFRDSRLTKEENALMNLEVTPDIEELLYNYAEQMGKLPEPILEDEIDDQHEPLVDGPDHERNLERAIPFLDKYFQLGEDLDKACNEFGWSELSAAKDMAWSRFIEEMEYNWLCVDCLDRVADKRLAQLENQGEQVDEDGWKKFLEMRSSLSARAKNVEHARYSQTRGFYDNAMKLTTDCKNFWRGTGGETINNIRKQRKELYLFLNQPIDEYGSTFWKYVSEYFKLKNEEISKSYVSTNDNSEVDDPNETLKLRNTIDCIADTYQIERFKEEKGDLKWEKIYSNILDRNLNRARQRDAMIG